MKWRGTVPQQCAAMFAVVCACDPKMLTMECARQFLRGFLGPTPHGRFYIVDDGLVAELLAETESLLPIKERACLT